MSLVNNQTDIFTSPTLEPNFDWQVGFNNFNSISSGVNFRVTIRPLTNMEQFTRIPNPTVLYEETGVILDGTTNLGLWQFTFDKNISISGGPFRDYQVVVEAHDQDGNTSAGTIVGTQGDTENGWTAYSNGYDIIGVSNPRPTGIELSFNLPTQDNATGTFNLATGDYQSIQYMGANGEIIIKFVSGVFESGIIGGFLYTSATQFPKQDIFAPTSFYGSRVQQTKFSFDINNPFIYSPHAAFNVRGAPYCFASVSFFDELDEVLLNKGIDISTGLYMSNNTPIYNDGAAGSMTMGGVATFFTVQTTGYPLISGARWSGLLGSGSTEIARVSTDGNINVPDNITTIFYMALGITGLYTGLAGGQPGGAGGNSTQNITGRAPGGFRGDMGIAINNGQWKPISGLNTGDSVICPIYTGINGLGFTYNYVIDNWRDAFFDNGNVYFGSGVITKMSQTILNTYYHIQSVFIITSTPVDYYISPEQLIVSTTFSGLPTDPNQHVILQNPSQLQTGFQLFEDQCTVTGITLITGKPTGFWSIEVQPYKLFYLSGSVTSHSALFNY